jgi:hypothetical protein
MNIHGVLARSTALPRSKPPPVHPPSAATPFRGALPRPPRGHAASRGLVPIYHPLRYPSNGHQSKAEITIRVCPVDEVDGGVDGKANRTGERERERAARTGDDGVARAVAEPSEWSAAELGQWSLPLNWKLRFGRSSVDFHPPY